MASRLLYVEFEVFGKVQGVFFRKYTLKQATTLGLKGWCMNTLEGTVKGALEGELEKIEEMKKWLQFTGSPNSKIEKVNFMNQKEIGNYSFDNFVVKH